MSLSVSASGGGDFPIIPEGQYTARCFKIIDLGTQWVEWKGDKKQQKKVLIVWEILDDTEKMEDGKPWAITKKYTASLDERGRLRPDLEAWRGKKFTEAELDAFDLKNVLGAYCTMQVVHSEDGKYANVQTLMAFKGEKPAPVNPNVSFDIDEPDMQVFESFSDRMKEQVEASAEWQARKLMNNAKPDVVIEDIGDEPINLDDIPF